MSKLNNILIVEPNKFNALNLKKILQTHISGDLSIHLRPDCIRIFEHLAQNPPDILLFDLMADVQNGNNTIKKIISEYPKLPVILFGSDEEIPAWLNSNDHIKFINRSNKDEVQIAALVNAFLNRQRAKLDVLNVESKYQAVFENLAFGIALTDLNGVPLEVNSRLTEFLGYSAEELKKMKFSEFSHPDDVVKDVELFQKMIAGDIKDFSVDKRYIRKDGKTVWAHTDVSLIRDDNEKPIYTVAIVRDIAAEREVEKKLLTEEDHFSALMDYMPDRIYFKDKKSRFTRVNAAFLINHGFSNQNEVLGKTDFDLFDNVHAEKARADEIKIMETGESIVGMIQKETYVDQAPTWSYTTKCPLRNEKGEIIGTFGISSDITKRVEAEERLQESEERLRHLYENISIGIYRADMNGKITFANPAILEMLQFDSLEQLQELDFEKHGYIDKDFRRKFHEKLLNEGAIEATENAWRLKSGEIIYLRESAKLHRDENGNPDYYEGTVEDVTERTLAEEKLRKYTEELQALNDSKDKFFSIIAHDLRSPFTALLGYSDIIYNDYDDMEGDEVKEYAKFINEEANNVYNLLDNLLTWSRIQTGRIKYNPDNLELSEIVKRTFGLYRESAKTKRISLEQELNGSDEIYSDENMVYTIIRNLLSNALKFTNEGGTVKIISFEDEGEMLRIGVQDDGIGMSEADQAKLFRSDVHHTTLGTGQEKGTGLGLLLCKDLVEKNGGNIWVESEQGVGTTFYFTVPLKSHAQKAESEN